MNSITTQIKTRLLHKKWGDAVILLDQVIKLNASAYENWLKTKCTLDCREMCAPFEKSERYRYMGEYDRLSFDNDVDSLDAAYCHVSNQEKG